MQAGKAGQAALLPAIAILIAMLCVGIAKATIPTAALITHERFGAWRVVCWEDYELRGFPNGTIAFREGPGAAGRNSASVALAGLRAAVQANRAIEAEERRRERQAALEQKRQQVKTHDSEARALQKRGDWAEAANSWAKAHESCEQAEDCNIFLNALRQARAMALGVDALAFEKEGDWERSVEILREAECLPPPTTAL
jgi:tetratricopeptide (TPR) repeat protein